LGEEGKQTPQRKKVWRPYIGKKTPAGTAQEGKRGRLKGGPTVQQWRQKREELVRRHTKKAYLRFKGGERRKRGKRGMGNRTDAVYYRGESKEEKRGDELYTETKGDETRSSLLIRGKMKGRNGRSGASSVSREESISELRWERSPGIGEEGGGEEEGILLYSHGDGKGVNSLRRGNAFCSKWGEREGRRCTYVLSDEE